MKNMNVSAKLIFGFAIVAILTAVVGATGIYGMSRMAAQGEEMYAKNLTAVAAMGDIREAFQQERVYLTSMLTHIDSPQIVQEYIDKVAESHLKGDAAVQKYMSVISDESLEGAFLEAGGLLNGPYFEAKEKIMQAALAGDMQGTLEAIDQASAYVSTIENNLATAERNHVTWAEEQHSANASLSRTLAIVQCIIILIACLAAIFLGIYISRLISKPLRLMTQFMNRAGDTGDISLHQTDIDAIGKFGKLKDEIGQCIASCAKFVQRMLAMAQALEIVAAGDLTVKIVLLSEKDSMGNSMQKMLHNLNKMFNEINVATAQLSIGSKQVADGAQMLAQGSTEQAATIQELSSSINEITDKTKTNANVAKEAAVLSGGIKSSAEKGSGQMNDMMKAVKEISEASSEIEKVIKVIDDIAFQTNILALNAAVEAARAGSAGKGFAVVAEEVRSLAAKSAAAAKDTGTLIENSVDKANLGLNIATETATSFKEIVAGINRSTNIVEQIAQSSDEQAYAISRINMGIDQVTQVVQQNSATAEQSASASEQMSGQSDALSQMISMFQLKDARTLPEGQLFRPA